mmetsp:Transcript_21220/g.15539  ORF Transcript_21220/g.15539 Transcript_21220/m.15539 type:complete len:131 (-) Transcript_21220:738-1130(-)|eukprot:CAMPEP_0202976390 /NCGR_PEP_ID=MMETSP1396-20130829/77046_1 /ASSEMBLY_ACC=CAM_ASM_000872 /TAXON_ID= /ORGANISM="Pseudokeronopsis sp., Strain Brazil" /LENGTH=130 /DNA_ID=CAMNT_0049713637 /DNA_START=114 /DNA_END=506 /DNA_ORIENTATION=-
MEVERILEEYLEDDDELREKLFHLRIHVETGKKISNVVEENDKLQHEIARLKREVARMRKLLLEEEKGAQEEMYNYNYKASCPTYEDQVVLHTEIVDKKDPGTEREFQLLEVKEEWRDERYLQDERRKEA